MMEVYMIRHTSVVVPRGTCYGWSDVPLAETFEEEAIKTRQTLGDVVFDQVFTSPLSRATRLAAFCGYSDAIRDERLKEMNMGAWEMKRYDDIAEEDPYILDWYNDYLNLPTKDGESFRDIYRRVAHFLDELRQQPFQRVAVFAHGGVLVCGGIYAGIISEQEAFKRLVPYGGIQTIVI